jgi:hypothetical protein
VKVGDSKVVTMVTVVVTVVATVTVGFATR